MARSIARCEQSSLFFDGENALSLSLIGDRDQRVGGIQRVAQQPTLADGDVEHPP